MTGLDLAGLRAAAEAATPGEWEPSIHRSRASVETVGRDGTFIADVGIATYPEARANAEHIAAFDPPTALALLDRLAQVTAERDAARLALRACADVRAERAEGAR